MPDLPLALQFAWLIPALPFAAFIAVGLGVSPLSKRAAGLVATLAVAAAALCAWLVAWEYYGLYPPDAAHPAIVVWSFEWLPYDAGLSASAGVLLDPIAVLLLVVVTTVSALIHVYSIGYMGGDPGYGRFFTYMNLFTFSMLGLVVAPNIIQMYVCWELVGLSSFLLIGFYYSKPEAVAAAKKAFIVTRFADLGFLIGILLLGFHGHASFAELAPAIAPEAAAQGVANLQAFDFHYLTHPEVLARLQAASVPFLGLSLLTLAMVLVFMGAAGKSAMFPLHIWLPDAMEGPTPVSALIHAATMVVAGVYLVARLMPAFAASGDALAVVMGVGVFTSLFAAVIAVTQDDIKRILAFSTLSQIGYMMLALGVCSPAHPLGYTAGMFHLATHAFFKALLFLCAGAVIHAVHSNNIWDMGGLARKMPITHAAFLAATLAIAGVWPFAGFFSKDEILLAAFSSGHTAVFAAALLVAGLTAFYMFRLYFVTFWGGHRGPHAAHAREAPAVMWVPLAALAAVSAVAGFVPIGSFVSWGEAHEVPHCIDLRIAIPATAIALLGFALAWRLYARDGAGAARAAAALGILYRTIKRKFYVDEAYLAVTKGFIFPYIARPIAWFDRHAVDGGVDLAGWITRTTGRLCRRLQTGQVQTYGVWFVGGILFVLLLLWAALA
ncbi:MAG TPA: NADH-quinone oxidoreductase subunit L [Planctomycetota bacterium]|jgi:NADH-quinone oxidoreductase subunit L|nr:NADH-quinone oxidoreductase subunit L [Planctomycetota bacterium]OQC19781.1 MAG: NADH-quinone oxidoreductase subunit 12 [Planctomycetes bacterium ADurb.Bin069]HNR97752.1 NADH-quinone oxidoreductase subunit L [Planctomycetota bacterium]HNU24781.1 NADH-quinone oxidoreductase subunit L [Planctomycetota bacterium]HOE30921.1 NADH-quinone oxidoreductase subunit L [Planctomycetota bacterium]